VEEMDRIGEQLVDTSQTIKIRGEWTMEKIDNAIQEAKLMEAVPDRIVIMGPGNAQVKHGRMEVRGKGPERKIVYNEDRSIPPH
jgi:CO dehydrogenase/acetyl-CoA synthase gamma subunit (corrinoid Fe-S protein)